MVSTSLRARVAALFVGVLAGGGLVLAQDALRSPGETPIRQPVSGGLEVQRSGHGEPQIIFLCDLAASETEWDHVVARFEVGYRCHVMLPESLLGSQTNQMGSLLNALADAVVAYAQDQGLTRPVLVGQGSGGVLALKIALKAPDLPGRLLLVDSLPWSVGQRKTEARKSVAPDLAAAQRAVAELLATDLRPDLAKVRCPVLVLGTLAGGATVPRKIYRQQYRSLPGVRFAFFGRARPPLVENDLDGFTNALRLELLAQRKSARIGVPADPARGGR